MKSGSKIRCENKKASVEAVCIDRNGAYRAVIKEQLPDAAVVYDRFHLIQNINKAIDEVRREAYREADAEGKNVIKGQRFNLYRNPENLSDTGEVALSYLLDINKKLNIAYVLKDQFRLVWTYSKAGWARRFLQSWVWWAKASGVQPMVRFAKGIQRDLEDIISWCRHRISNGKIEGFNSTISRIIHKSRGIPRNPIPGLSLSETQTGNRSALLKESRHHCRSALHLDLAGACWWKSSED